MWSTPFADQIATRDSGGRGLISIADQGSNSFIKIASDTRFNIALYESSGLQKRRCPLHLLKVKFRIGQNYLLHNSVELKWCPVYRAWSARGFSNCTHPTGQTNETIRPHHRQRLVKEHFIIRSLGRLLARLSNWMLIPCGLSQKVSICQTWVGCNLCLGGKMCPTSRSEDCGSSCLLIPVRIIGFI